MPTCESCGQSLVPWPEQDPLRASSGTERPASRSMGKFACTSKACRKFGMVVKVDASHEPPEPEPKADARN